MRIRGQYVHVNLYFQKMKKEKKKPTFLLYHKYCDTMQLGHTFRLTQKEFDDITQQQRNNVVI